ncbi:MAG: response regulator, partial [Psychrosphaera sp.]|nr:response regulator [Psychrosphaera sp.]
SRVVVEFLEMEKYEGLHFTTMPRGGLEEMIDLVKVPPFVVLMDVRLDSDNGFDICHLFKHHTFFADVPVVFMSGLIGEDDILLAYEAGAYDYLPKPVTLKTLSAKCKLIRKFTHHTADLKSQVSSIESVAMDAMTTSSELGGILRFHEKIADVNQLQMLAEALVGQLATFGVSVSVMFSSIDEQVVYHSDDGQVYELEKQVFKMLKNQGRIYSWSNRTLFNYNGFSVLVRSMPIEDEDRVGNLKDQICLLLNGVEGRVRGIINELQLQNSEGNIRMIGKTIGKLVLDIQTSNLALSEQFEKVINDLEVDFNEEISNLNLLQSEEGILMGLIKSASNNACNIF